MNFGFWTYFLLVVAGVLGLVRQVNGEATQSQYSVAGLSSAGIDTLENGKVAFPLGGEQSWAFVDESQIVPLAAGENFRKQ